MFLRNTLIIGFTALAIASWDYPRFEPISDYSFKKSRTNVIELLKDNNKEPKNDSLEEDIKSIENEMDEQKNEIEIISKSIGSIYFDYTNVIIDRWSDKTDLYLNLDFVLKLNKFAEAEFYSRDVLKRQKVEAARYKSVLKEYFAYTNDHSKSAVKKMEKNIDNIIYRIEHTLTKKNTSKLKPKKDSRVSDSEFNANTLLSEYINGRVDELLDTSEDFISIYDSIKAKNYRGAKTLNDNALKLQKKSATVLKQAVYSSENILTVGQVELLGIKIDDTLNKISEALYTTEI